jgi:mRNA interferase RelE/StbE
MYRIEFARKAARFYQRADTITARRLNLIFNRLSQDPLILPNTKRLKGELLGSYRIRMGDLRIIYSVDEENNVIYIEVIGFRGDVYKK